MTALLSFLPLTIEALCGASRLNAGNRYGQWPVVFQDGSTVDWPGTVHVAHAFSCVPGPITLGFAVRLAPMLQLSADRNTPKLAMVDQLAGLRDYERVR